MTGNNRPCPDDLGLRAQRHEVSDLERRALDAHLAQCGPCQAASAVAALFDAIPETEPGDSALIARVIGKTTRTYRLRRSNGLRAAAIVALVVLACGTAVGAWVVYRGAERRMGDKSLPESKASRATAHAEGLFKRTAEPETPAALEAPAPFARGELKRPVGTEPRRRQALPVPMTVPSIESEPAREENTPASLFAQANALRRAGEIHHAIDLYQALRQRFPDSQQAHLSAISQGDLLLGEGESAKAVAAYSAYLQTTPDGSLTEEAIFGKARGLSLLGRSGEEKQAWEELARRFPRSAYHPAALRRLRELAQ
jgi:TolA-binding protein